MKNLFKIGALSVALVAVVFMLNTNAQTTDDTGIVSLEVTGQSGYCQYGLSLFVATTGFSYDAQSITGEGFLTTGGNTEWFCEDKAGIATRGLSIDSSDLVSTTNASHTIPAASVKMQNPEAITVAGACTANAGASQNLWISIGTSKLILGKTSALGEACKVLTSGLNLAVDLAASQAVGLYSGTLTVSVPTL